METIVDFNRLDLATHPVVRSLVQIKWNAFAKQYCYFQAFMYILLLLCFTISALLSDLTHRHRYDTTSDKARIAFEIATLCLLGYHIWEEYSEFRIGKKILEFRIKKVEDVLAILTPDQHSYKLRTYERDQMMKTTGFQLYISQRSNRLDCIAYFLISVTVLLRIANVAAHSSHKYHVDGYSVDSLMRADSGFLAFTMIGLWLKLFKYGQLSTYLGPFVVMMSRMINDTFLFLSLWIIVLIAFGCGFMVVFKATPGDDDFGNFFTSLLSVYLASFGNFDYQTLKDYDDVLAPLLFIPFGFMSVILFLNIFIAMLNNTFTRIYSRSKDIAEMGLADLCLQIERRLSEIDLQKHRQAVWNMTPHVDYLVKLDDSDLTENLELNELKDEMTQKLEKHTSSIKSKLESMEEKFSDMQRALEELKKPTSSSP